jgi:hypothetical protein
MRKLIAAGAALVLATAALPALAGDLVYETGPDSLTSGLDGHPYWSAQAQCAGLFGAAAQHLTAEGDHRAAEEAKATAMSFAKHAIARLTKDRKLTRAQALNVITPSVLRSRERGLELLAGDNGPQSSWNYARSGCLDIADAYTTYAGW